MTCQQPHRVPVATCQATHYTPLGLLVCDLPPDHPGDHRVALRPTNGPWVSWSESRGKEVVPLSRWT